MDMTVIYIARLSESGGVHGILLCTQINDMMYTYEKY